MKTKVGMLMMAGMLLTTSAGFAAPSVDTLKNKQGEVVYELKLLTEQDRPKYKEDDLVRGSKSSQIAEGVLKEATAALIYVAENNPEQVLETEVRSAWFTNASKLREQLVDQPVMILDSLNNGYKYANGSIIYEAVTDVNPLSQEEEKAITDKLREQAEQSPNKYAVMPVEVSKDHWALLSTYKKGSQKIYVSIARTEGKTRLWMNEKDYESITTDMLAVNDVEMMYSQYKAGGKGLTWVVDVPGTKQTIRHHIDAGKEVSKQELINIAKEYIQ